MNHNIIYSALNKNKEEHIFSLSKNRLRDGVHRAILIANDTITMCERLFFNYKDSVSTEDKQYAALELKVNGEVFKNQKIEAYKKTNLRIERADGNPFTGEEELSISISDDNNRPETSYSDNIYTWMLLGSEIKGYIPDASRYFDPGNENRFRELDLLMLTRGWTSYNWDFLSLTKKITLLHPVEKGILLKGRYVRNVRSSKFGEIATYDIVEQKNKKFRFYISYTDSVLTEYDFASDGEGVFRIVTDDFYGKRCAVIKPVSDKKIYIDSLFSFRLDRYFSPPPRLYHFWESREGSPYTRKNLAFSKLSPFEYLFDAVDITAEKKEKRGMRPMRSEMRLDFLDEWEYAQDVTYLYSTTKKVRENNRFLNETRNELNDRFGYPKEVENKTRFIDPYNMALDDIVLTAKDVVISAIWRHGFNWAYWVQMMVVKGEYGSDEIPLPDKEYLKGRSPSKMMNFKELVIRSDIETRKQFIYTADIRYKNKNALSAKRNQKQFYEGFLGFLSVPLPGRDNMDNYPRADIFYDRIIRNQEMPYPENPNYVVAFIPYNEKSDYRKVIPSLSSITAVRFTMIYGYNESKQFYNPDYSSVKPSDEAKDIRRTLYWNSDLYARYDSIIEIEFYNNSESTTLHIDINGVDENILYGNIPYLKTRTKKDAERKNVASKESGKSQPFQNNIDFNDTKQFNEPAIEVYYEKITSRGRELYDKGEHKKAFKLFAEASAGSYAPAIFNMGICYMNGTGIKQSLRKGVESFM